MMLSCALCLDEVARPVEYIQKAVTIANGQAVCPLHFATVRDLASTTGGPLSLGHYRGLSTSLDNEGNGGR